MAQINRFYFITQHPSMLSLRHLSIGLSRTGNIVSIWITLCFYLKYTRLPGNVTQRAKALPKTLLRSVQGIYRQLLHCTLFQSIDI